MTLLLALVIAALFGSGAYLLLKHDLVRVAAGVLLISNSASLLVVAVALTRGVAPIYPLPAQAVVSDPLAQAMVLTSLVITFATTAFLLSLVFRFYGVFADARDSTSSDELL
ncbi:MAG: NADH-quinone oxidoreductase subunit K [Chloroflexota bacterium]|nr:NADH-quinone oxidoreductase subunit K [Chloroflexota bacterium]